MNAISLQKNIPSGLPAEVIGVMKKLTQLINTKKDLRHPSVMSKAKQLFRDLHFNQISCQFADLEKWAILNGWLPNHTKGLKRAAKVILA